MLWSRIFATKKNTFRIYIKKKNKQITHCSPTPEAESDVLHLRGGTVRRRKLQQGADHERGVQGDHHQLQAVRASARGRQEVRLLRVPRRGHAGGERQERVHVRGRPQAHEPV